MEQEIRFVLSFPFDGDDEPDEEESMRWSFDTIAITSAERSTFCSAAITTVALAAAAADGSAGGEPVSPTLAISQPLSAADECSSLVSTAVDGIFVFLFDS